MPKFSPERQHERFEIKLVVRCHGQDSEEHVTTEAQNIGLGGVFLATHPPFMPPIGTRLTVGVVIPEEDLSTHEVSVAGEVVHWIPGAGVGIRFDQESAPLKRLEKFLARLKKRHR